MRWLIPHFHALRWRLTLSYAAVTLAALLSLEVVFVVVPALVAINAPQRPHALVEWEQKLAPRLLPALRQSPPDRAGLGAALAAYQEPLLLSEGITENVRQDIAIVPGQNAALLALGSDGQVLASRVPPSGSTRELTTIQALPQARTVVAAALRGATNAEALIQSVPDGRTVAAAPITDASGRVWGALLLSVNLPTLIGPLYSLQLLGLLASLIPFSLIAGVLGAVFGSLTARGFTRRLRGLTTAAEAWSQGDFSATARDPSQDELGQLARDLNRMAEQIRSLLSARRELAVMEERNRLARDLHDSVKQQVFAASMQIAAARAQVRRDPAAAEARLADIERLIGAAQRELTGLIHELRPAALANNGLAAALQEYCADWSRGFEITVETRVSGERPAPLEVEQALFRVAQEALANVARHSGATRVEVALTWEPDALVLAVTDNGLGFDAGAAVGTGVGLQSMRERIETFGGALVLGANPGGTGARVEARVPDQALSTLAISGDATSPHAEQVREPSSGPR